jgi:diguanylate cyclase (GGDEF)-like protein
MKIVRRPSSMSSELHTHAEPPAVPNGDDGERSPDGATVSAKRALRGSLRAWKRFFWRTKPTAATETETVRAPTPRRVRRPDGAVGCKCYVAVALVVLAAYFINPHRFGLSDATYRFPIAILLNASAVGALVVGIRRWRPQYALPWWLMVIGQALYTVGDLLSFWGIYVSHVSVFPGPADLLYLGRVPFMIVALALIIRRRSGQNRAALLDSAIVGMAVGVVFWVYLMAPYTEVNLELTARLTSLAYPMTDLMLIVMAVRLLAGDGIRSAAFRFLTGGLVLLVITDSVDGWANLHGEAYHSGSLVELGWLLFYISVGAMGLHPSMREVATKSHVRGSPLSKTRLAVLGAAALTGPVLAMIEYGQGDPHDAFPIALASLIVIVLIMIRLAEMMHRERQADEKMRFQAFHDALTGLANRALLYDRMEVALTRSRRNLKGVAVLLMDLDRFKAINDTLGHAAGDRVLQEVASRLGSSTRAHDTIARMGGDEFVVLMEDVESPEVVEALASRILTSMAEPFDIDGVTVELGGSIGIAFAEPGSIASDQLLRQADAAMYESKRTVPGRFRVFEPGFESPHLSVSANEIREALAQGEMFVHYQPIASANSGAIDRIEALARWQHPTRGEVRPGVFIPIAEKSEVIVEIGAFVLSEACNRTARWNRVRGGENLCVNVNLSARELAYPDFVPRVVRTLTDSGLDPRHLTFELTEGTLLVNQKLAATKLEELRRLGVGVALDDFGTEYSSLAHLRWLPVDCIKIDKVFVDGVITEVAGANFVEAVVRFGHNLGLTIVAEGVEDSEQLLWLRRIGCDFVQGYLISPAIPAAGIATLLGFKEEAASRVR